MCQGLRNAALKRVHKEHRGHKRNLSALCRVWTLPPFHLCKPALSLAAVGGFAFDVAHVDRQVGVADHLAHGLNLADVIPVMVGDAAQRRADALAAALPVAQPDFFQLFGGQRIEKRISRPRHLPPDVHHLAQRRGPHRRAEGELLVEVREEDFAPGPFQPVTLLVPRQMADRPADAVHRAEVPRPFLFGDAFQSAQPLAARETKLIHQWVRHGIAPVKLGICSDHVGGVTLVKRDQVWAATNSATVWKTVSRSTSSVMTCRLRSNMTTCLDADRKSTRLNSSHQLISY